MVREGGGEERDMCKWKGEREERGEDGKWIKVGTEVGEREG